MKFSIKEDYTPKGDQADVITTIIENLRNNMDFQTIIGATGTGKTYVMAKVIEAIQKPALILAHNKTLSAQLYKEFKEFFPHNAVEYFVSYYDYFQPEAYVAKKDLYIEKDASINEEIDRLRLKATASLIERQDVIVVATVSCIYGLGSPEFYKQMYIHLKVGEQFSRKAISRSLVDIQYARNDANLKRSTFRIQGDVIDIYPAYEDIIYRIELFGDEIERISALGVFNQNTIQVLNELTIFPAKHFVMPEKKLNSAISLIETELDQRLVELEEQKKMLERERLASRTKYDLEMIRSMGYCSGIENYSRHLSGRKEGEPPATLIDYFPENFLTFIDESHISIPQLRGMYNGDRARKLSLVEYGFRLPSALDNRPLVLSEFKKKTGRTICVSATPNEYELELSADTTSLINRPTGILDPVIEIRPSQGQVDDLLLRAKDTIKRGFRVLITTITKKMAEDLTLFLQERSLKVKYIHSEVETIERVEIIKSLRLGECDVLVGINLLREGLDLPEVALIAILDADKAGFLRSKNSLLQIVGRAARNTEGHVIMYGDRTTDAMASCIQATNQRREIQAAFNLANGITPTTIIKKVSDMLIRTKSKDDASSKVSKGNLKKLTETDILAGDSKSLLSQKPKNKKEASTLIKRLSFEMKLAGDQMEFELAILLRNKIDLIKAEYKF